MSVTSAVNPYTATNVDTVLLQRPGVLAIVNVVPGSATVTATIYDDSIAQTTGKILAIVNATTTGTGSNSLALGNVQFLKGIFVKFTTGSGTGANVTVYTE